MPLTIQMRDDFWDRSSVPLEVDTFQIEQYRELSIDQISQAMIWQGKTKIEMGEAFKISGSLSDSIVIWQGNLSRVHWIGAKLSLGTIRVEGNAGRHVGSQMSGGEIIVQGNLSDFAGVEMSGGTIRVSGDAGHRVGARYPGSAYGMNRGSVFIEGSVGHGLGENMRRGTIVVGGDAGDLAGWNMLAGTICVAGDLGRHPGAGMVRGSIVCCSNNRPELLPTFSAGPRVATPEWMNILSRWLKDNQVVEFADNLLNASFQLYSGDRLYGGRGEIWLTS